jgi:hypothetical protein
MKFNQLERALVVGCSAVFLLATADGMGMTWVCPASGPGTCSERAGMDLQAASTAAAIRTSGIASRDAVGFLELCRWDRRGPDEQLNDLTASVPPPPPSELGIPCPVGVEGNARGP